MAAIIAKRVLEEIRHRSDIVDLVGTHLKLVRAGGSFKALCPFHKEKTPSFTVDPRRQSFHCFGCGVGGDVFAFVQQYENVDFIAAVKLLAERAGVPLELEEGEAGGVDKGALYRVHEGVSQFYRRCLDQMASAEVARSYLTARDLQGGVVDDFAIGYAPKRWDALLQWGRKHKVKTEQLEACGLIMQSSRPNADGRYYDRFRHRIMFPIRDAQSRIIGFSGRLLEDDDKAAKYVNSPETLLFKKSRVLYALDRARRPIVDAGVAIICEGQIDVIRCHQAGIANAVAAQGTAFTEDHARIVGRYADAVVLVFDSDTAGQDAAVKAAGVFMASGLAVRIAMLPDRADPDSFIRSQGADAFRRLIDEATSAVRFQIAALGRRERADTEVGGMRIARAVLDTISQSPNAVQRARLVQEAAEVLQLPETALNDELNARTRRNRYRDASHENEDATPPETIRRSGEEVALCEHLVRLDEAPELKALVETYLPLDMLSDTSCRIVAGACLASATTGREIHDILREMVEEPEAILQFAAALQAAPMKVQGTDRSRTDAVKDLILRLWKRRLRDERARLRQSERTDPSNEMQQRLAQINQDLDSLKSWDFGSPVIEIELAQ